MGPHPAGLLLQSSEEIRTWGQGGGSGRHSREETEYKFKPRHCQLVPAELEDKNIWEGIQEAETLRIEKEQKAFFAALSVEKRTSHFKNPSECLSGNSKLGEDEMVLTAVLFYHVPHSKSEMWASPVARWLRIHLPMQGTRV